MEATDKGQTCHQALITQSPDLLKGSTHVPTKLDLMGTTADNDGQQQY